MTEYFSNYKSAKQILEKSRTNFNSMSAAVLFIPDQSEIVHIEQADYRKFHANQTQTRLKPNPNQIQTSPEPDPKKPKL